MSKASRSASTPTATWLRRLAFGMMVMSFAADRGRLIMEQSDQCIVSSKGPLHDRFGNKTGVPGIDGFFCLLLSMFREIFMFPISRAMALLFGSIAVPATLNVFWRARTRAQVFKAFVLLCSTQTITFGMAAALYYSPTFIPPVRRTAKGTTNHDKRTASSVSTRYVWWTTTLIIAAQPALAALVLAPVENDAVYVIANGLFQVGRVCLAKRMLAANSAECQWKLTVEDNLLPLILSKLYPIILLPALLVKPLDEDNFAADSDHSGNDSRCGVRLVVRLFDFAAWWSALLYWAGIAGIFVKPAVSNESAYGLHSDMLSPSIASLLAGSWEWSLPGADQLGAGPFFFILDCAASILGVWASQMESGHSPRLGDAIVGGPAYAVAKSMAKTWNAALWR